MKPARQRRKPGDYLFELFLSFWDKFKIYFPPFILHPFMSYLNLL
jgi:hypothetical protein